MFGIPIFFVVVIAIAAVVFVVISLFGSGLAPEREKIGFKYRRKQFFMTRAEHEFYDALIRAVGGEYYIFAQVHLPTIVDHTTKGQNWRSALAHINRKSVDFVLCDKTYLSPKLAIELDDKSHARPDRQERDTEVERILRGAGVPLLRIENHGSFNPDEIAQKIHESEINS